MQLRERASLIEPDDTKQEGLRTMMSAATEIEVDIMANVFGRALGRPESGFLIPGTANPGPGDSRTAVDAAVAADAWRTRPAATGPCLSRCPAPCGARR